MDNKQREELLKERERIINYIAYKTDVEKVKIDITDQMFFCDRLKKIAKLLSEIKD